MRFSGEGIVVAILGFECLLRRRLSSFELRKRGALWEPILALSIAVVVTIAPVRKVGIVLGRFRVAVLRLDALNRRINIRAA